MTGTLEETSKFIKSLDDTQYVIRIRSVMFGSITLISPDRCIKYLQVTCYFHPLENKMVILKVLSCRPVILLSPGKFLALRTL